MDKIPIVFAFDNNHILPASIAIKSLLDSKNSSTEYEIYILHSGISEKIQESFSKIANISWLEVDKKIFETFPISSNWSELVYYRILIPELIKEWDKIIYSDVDVLFRGDLTKVYDIELGNNYWGGVIAEKNDSNTICHKYFEENKNEYIYMSGFMVINSKKMRDENIVQKVFKNIETFNSRLRFFDLDVLNISCDKIVSLPFEYCVLENIYDSKELSDAKEYPWLSKVYTDEELNYAKQNPVIIHYAGSDIKIWNRRYKEIPKYYWNYIIQSPFYCRDKYFWTVKRSLKYFGLTFLLMIVPIKHLRKRIKRKYQEVKNAS